MKEVFRRRREILENVWETNLKVEQSNTYKQVANNSKRY
jgi:hypothetical protein